jgi:hypothetical protein
MVRQHKTHEFCGGCCLDALELVHHANAHGPEKEKATTENRVGTRPMTGGHGFGDGKFSVMVLCTEFQVGGAAALFYGIAGVAFVNSGAGLSTENTAPDHPAT